MATWTEADLGKSVLEQLGVLGTGQSPAAADLKKVTDAWASIHDQLRGEALAPFAVGVIPLWAQMPLTKYVAGEVGTKFGHRTAESQGLFIAAQTGYMDLKSQNAGGKHGVRTKSKSY